MYLTVLPSHASAPSATRTARARGATSDALFAYGVPCRACRAAHAVHLDLTFRYIDVVRVVVITIRPAIGPILLQIAVRSLSIIVDGPVRLPSRPQLASRSLLLVTVNVGDLQVRGVGGHGEDAEGVGLGALAIVGNFVVRLT